MTRYWVSAVRYSSNGQHIDQVREHASDGTTMAAPITTARANVAAGITAGTRYDTMYLVAGKWTAGAQIGTVTVNGTRYLRTDGDQTAADNLGNLPTF